MNKKELVNKIMEATGENRVTVGKVVDAMVTTVVQTVAGDESVVIAGLGTFLAKAREARKGRNPSTGEEMDIPAKRVPAFKAASEFKKLTDK